MLVCPKCRTVNDEDHQVCSSCGRSLEPGQMALGVRRRDDELEELDVPPHRPPSVWRTVGIAGGIAAVGLGVALFLLLRPDPCRGKVSSDRFGSSYCVAVPHGWTAEPAALGDQAVVDEFTNPPSAATVLVVAFDLQDGTSLEAYAAATRQADKQSGLKPGTMRQATLDGLEARTWDIDSKNRLGERFRTREVVTVVGGNVGWTVELSDTAAGFDAHLPSFEEILGSWHFR